MVFSIVHLCEKVRTFKLALNLNSNLGITYGVVSIRIARIIYKSIHRLKYLQVNVCIIMLINVTIAVKTIIII